MKTLLKVLKFPKMREDVSLPEDSGDRAVWSIIELILEMRIQLSKAKFFQLFFAALQTQTKLSAYQENCEN